MSNKKNILIIEDDLDHQALIERTFHQKVYEGSISIVICASLAESRDLMNHNTFDLIITDVNLPDGKGSDLLKLNLTHKVPIIMMTSQGNESAAVDAIKNGAINYVVKSEEAFLNMPFASLQAIQEWKLSEERKRHELELLEKNEQLEKTRKELERIAYSVSHDLTTPVNGIIKLADWIQEDLPNEDLKVQENFRLLKARALRLKKFIDGILDYSKLGTIIQPENIDLSPVLEEVIDSLESTGNVVFNVQSKLPHIVATRYLVFKLFRNLVHNAIFHNPGEAVTIDISYEHKPDGFIFSVKDNGRGISEKYHETIFDMFSSLERIDENESIGMGLTVAKKIVENAGGSIWVESSPEMGADFKFTWPS